MKQRLKRLTHEPPEGMYEALHNTAIVKNREVFLRGMAEDGGDLNLCAYCGSICKKYCDADLTGVPSDEFAEYMDCDCPVSLVFTLAVGAAEMREKLKKYEDEEENERSIQQ